MTRPLRILIVDDLPLNRKLLRAQLESEGHTVVAAANGMEALEVLERQETELIVSDILMPVMDGYRLCYEVRRDPRFRELPFIAYTASYVNDSDRKLSLDLGADRYLVKPAPLRELVRAIDEALSSPGHRPVATIPETIEVLTEYSERLVAKLEKRNVKLLEAEETLRVQESALHAAAAVRKNSERQLRDANEQLRVLLDYSPAVTYALTLEGETVIPRHISENITRILGFSVAESLATEWWSGHIHPEDRAGADARIAVTVARGASCTEFRIRHLNGSYRTIEDNQRLVQDRTGRGAQVVGVWTDITERKESEASLRDSEAMLAAIFEASRDGILVEDDGLVVFANAAYAHILGFDTGEELIGKHLTETVAPDDVERLLEYGRARLREETPPTLYEFKARRKDGAFVDLEASVSVSSVNGRRYITTAVRDITERKQAHALAREQASLIDQAHDAIVVCDLDDKVTFWSKGAERLYGFRAAEALGVRFDELLKVKPGAFDVTRTSIMDGGVTAEIEKTTATGAAVIVDSSSTLLCDEQGAWSGILSIDSDITDRKKLEKQSFRAQRLESLGTLAGGIAHDLNNLLLPILMGVTMLKRLGPDERSLKAITNMEASVKRGRDLVNRILLFASGSEGARAAVDLRKIVSEVEGIADSTFPKTIAFVTSMPDTLRCAIGDETQLTQVLLNLCVNARDAMPDGGRLSISAANVTIDQHFAVMHGGTTAGPYVKLEVADNGVGIPEEVVDRIFEPFFTTKGLGKGTGLGLSTVQGLLRSHGGFIEVASEVGRGTTFRIFLPAHAEAMAVRELQPETGDAPRGNGERILVVDDEAPILEITRQTLEAFGYAVLTAQDGAQALGIYGRDQAGIAAVVTDMMMPIMGGASLIAALRQINAGIPIIATSGHAEPGELVPRAVSGATTYLAKPYGAEVLLRTLSEVLSGPSLPVVGIGLAQASQASPVGLASAGTGTSGSKP